MNVVLLCDAPCKWMVPLTNLPKALLPVCGRPLLAYLLDQICDSHMAEAVLLVTEDPEIRSLFDSRYRTLALDYAPAAPDRTVADTLLITKPSLFACNLSAALETHREAGVSVTAIGARVGMPSRYALLPERLPVFGVVPQMTHGGLADTGFAILAADVPLSGELQRLCAAYPACIYADTAPWDRIGSVEEYLRCQRTMAASGMETGGHRQLDGVHAAGVAAYPQVEFLTPVHLGRQVEIGADCSIGDSVIGDHVTIGRGAVLNGCVVQAGAYIGENVICRDAWICRGAMLMHGCRLEAGSAIGEHANIGERAVVEAGVRVFAGKRVPPRTVVEVDVRSGAPVQLQLEETGICGDLSPAAAVRLGNALAGAEKRIAVGYAPDAQAAHVLAMAVCAGACAAGAACMILPDCALPELSYASRLAACGLLVHADTGLTAGIRLYAAGGLPLIRRQEQQITARLHGYAAPPLPPDKWGRMTGIGGMEALYAHQLRESLPPQMPVCVELSTGNPRLRRLGETLLYGGSGEALVLQLSADGRQLSAYTEATGFVTSERLLLAACSELAAEQQHIALPEPFTGAADRVAAGKNRRVLRYRDASDESDTEARQLAAAQGITVDGLRLAAVLLRALHRNGGTLAALLALLPAVYTAKRVIPAGDGASALLRTLCGKPDTSGFHREDARGRLHLRLSRSGHSIQAYAEARSMEAAAELCAEAEAALRRGSKG